jgi:hypothetical protein
MLLPSHSSITLSFAVNGLTIHAFIPRCFIYGKYPPVDSGCFKQSCQFEPYGYIASFNPTSVTLELTEEASNLHVSCENVHHISL